MGVRWVKATATIVGALGLMVTMAATCAPEYVILVDSLGDGPDAAIGDGVCATAAGDCTLRAAVDESGSSPERWVQIRLPAGTISLASDLTLAARTTLTGSTDGRSTVAGWKEITVPPGVSLNGSSFDLVGQFYADGPGDLALADIVISGTTGGVSSAGDRHLSLYRVDITGAYALLLSGSDYGQPPIGSAEIRESRIRGLAATGIPTKVWDSTFDSPWYDPAVRLTTKTPFEATRITVTGKGDGVQGIQNQVSITDSTIDVAQGYAVEGGVVTVVGSSLTSTDGIVGNVSVRVERSTLRGQYYTVRSKGLVTFDRSTIVGGRWYANADYRLQGSIVTGTRTDAGCAPNIRSTGSNVFASAACVALDPTDVVGDPLIALDVSGVRPAFRPQPGSPAIDLGGSCELVDQLGAARPQDGDGDGTAACDAGSIEVPALP